jgi:hypothetical protein
MSRISSAAATTRSDFQRLRQPIQPPARSPARISPSAAHGVRSGRRWLEERRLPTGRAAAQGRLVDASVCAKQCDGSAGRRRRHVHGHADWAAVRGSDGRGSSVQGECGFCGSELCHRCGNGIGQIGRVHRAESGRLALPLVTLQLGEPAWQGTELFPVATSLNMQPEPSLPLDVQDAPEPAARL